VNIQLGEVIFGGVGAGLYGILIMVILSVFIAGLMVGRTPEYLGKKIEAKEMKLVMLYVLIFPLLILGFTACGAVFELEAAKTAASQPAQEDGKAATPDNMYGGSSQNNSGAHGLSEILYAYTSGTGNNGSAFAGLNANTPWYNVTLGIAMLFGRYLMIVPLMGVAGAMVGKKTVAPSLGTFPTSGGLFSVLLIGVILIVGALTFFPALSLGPVVEHFLAAGGKLY
jgi:K+-transporting ATPase ATPase A chain